MKTLRNIIIAALLVVIALRVASRAARFNEARPSAHGGGPAGVGAAGNRAFSPTGGIKAGTTASLGGRSARTFPARTARNRQ